MYHRILALDGVRPILLAEAVVVVDVKADEEVPRSDGMTEAPSVPLVSATKGGSGRGRLAAAAGNVACSSGVNVVVSSSFRRRQSIDTD